MEPSDADFDRTSGVQKARSGVRKFWRWLSGIGIAAVTALLLVYFQGVLGAVTTEISCHVRGWFHEPAPGTHFTILITNLAGDPDGRQTNLVRDTFRGQRGVDARRTCRTVELDGKSEAEAEAKAAVEGQAMLQDWNADLLIWGEVKKADEEVSLWILSREGHSTFGSESYSVTEKLTLPGDFKHDLAAQLHTVAFSQIVPKASVESEKLVALLTPAAERLRNLLFDGGEFRPDRNPALLYRFGQAATMIGVHSEDPMWLKLAVAAYRQVSSQWTREGLALGWAAVQQDLGTTLYELGELKDDLASLNEAASALLGSLEEWTRAKVWPRVNEVQLLLSEKVLPNLVASSYSNPAERATQLFQILSPYLLADIYSARRLGSDSSSSQKAFKAKRPPNEASMSDLEAAVKLYNLSLDEWPHASAPKEWAEIQLHLAILYYYVGLVTADPSYVAQSIAATEGAIHVWASDTGPLHDALGNMMLGMLFLYSDILNGNEEKSLAALNSFDAALASLDPATHEQLWWTAHLGFGTVLARLAVQKDAHHTLQGKVSDFATRSRTAEPDLGWGLAQNLFAAILGASAGESDTAPLEEAAAALRSVLELYAERDAAGEWSPAQEQIVDASTLYVVTHENLGSVLTVLGNREGEIAHFDGAARAFRTAISRVPRKQQPDSWARLQEGLGLALMPWGTREGDTGKLWAAEVAFRAAQEEWTREQSALHWARNEYHAGTVLLSIAEKGRGTLRLEEAMAALKGSQEVFRAEGMGAFVEDVDQSLMRAEALLGQRSAAGAAQ